jgi:ubiquinone/menaquinone biosynthesis C-methylase UbiE
MSNMLLQPQQYWNTIGSTKDFEDPLYLDKLSPFLTKNSKILEYGCGYGRLMQILNGHGYHNLIGFDFAQSMITRGKDMDPNLDLRLLEEPDKIPCKDESIDAVIMSTVLCCMIDSTEHEKLLEEILRVLKNKGVLYLSDFLFCDEERYKKRYSDGLQNFGTWGIYTTSENLTVRHLTTQNVLQLLKNFDIQWFEQFDFKTMNQNPAQTFHCVAIKQSA